MPTVAILVPVTSRGTPDVATGVREMLTSVRDTTTSAALAVLFGVDRGDATCDPLMPASVDLEGLAREILPDAAHVSTRTFDYPAGHVCSIWSDLAVDAFGADVGADLAVLLGDDVRVLSPGWDAAIWASFESIARERGLPFGFACVAFTDARFPGFPTFPVLHRTHARWLPTVLPPGAFVNQHADPFLFQIYRAFGAARIEPRARLENRIGGAGTARYAKDDVVWNGRVLDEARSAARGWLRRELTAAAVDGASPPPPQQELLTLDVIVPTFRTPRAQLDAVIALRAPADVSVQTIVICDRPDSPQAAAVMDELQRVHADNPMVRLRTNARNIGGGASRNRGLAESAADFVLFLDDDVEPAEDILAAYAAYIRAHPLATGFVGNSELPKPTNYAQAGVILAGVTYFWTIARERPDETELPWGVTANLCVRRPRLDGPAGVRFEEAFPKTGGGEDIDFCLRLRAAVRLERPDSLGLVAAPDARIVHPWWDGGRPNVLHFAGWAAGDGHLIDRFPEHTYHALPNLVETALAVAALGAAAGCAHACWSRDVDTSSIACCARALQHALLFVGAATGACVAADLVLDCWLEFVQQPSKPCAHLPPLARLCAVGHGLVVRSASEAGRLHGHALRGNLFAHYGRRFNWFGYMWPGAIAVERAAAARSAIARATAIAGVLSLLI